jgi:uncharacterized membrane protein
MLRLRPSKYRIIAGLLAVVLVLVLLKLNGFKVW